MLMHVLATWRLSGNWSDTQIDHLCLHGHQASPSATVKFLAHGVPIRGLPDDVMGAVR